jgi:EAL domain-containing protein (putative c-di-GMP-specific phosphodiesterase class I)/signal transduction histidine kinase/CheY-like chemotaxis protein
LKLSFVTLHGRRRSIRGKLTLLVLLSVSLAVLLITGVSAWRDSQREAVLQTERLQAAAAVIASLSGEAADRGDRAGAYTAVRAIGAMPDVLYARVESRGGRLLAETGSGARLSGDAKVRRGESVSVLAALSSRTVEVTEPIVYARRPVGRVVLLGRLEGASGRLATSLLISLFAALAATGLGLAVAWRMQRRIAGPIVALTQAMNGVRETHDYSGTAYIEADDEVGELVDGFNAMLTQVRNRDAALAEHLSGLERTVAERTADLRLAKDAADAANSAKSDFLATMSHEIRTPMNGVMVMAEMLAAGEMPPRQRRFAEVIAKSGASLLAIINDILDFSKIEAGKMDLEAAPVDPAEIADDVASLFWEKARSKGLDLACYVAPGVPRLIEADAVRLRQVIGNLANNAIKFTQTGGVLLELTAPLEDRLRIAVHDTGIGIAKDKIAGLFDAFSQADQSTTRRFGGTGLGLAICKRLVGAMGGELSARSVVGRGSVFFFEIPVSVIEPAAPWIAFEAPRIVTLRLEGPSTRRALARYAEHAGLTLADADADLVIGQPAALEERHGAAAVLCLGEYGDDAPARLQREGKVDAVLTQPVRRQDLVRLLDAWRQGQPLAQALDAGLEADHRETATFGGRRVLVVDDSAVNREVAMEALARLGVAASLANDGRAGVEAVLSGTFDLVLMDGSMPDMDGYQATREIRRREQDEGRSPTPIVALTAHVVGAAADAWRDAGMDTVLHKPFTLAALSRVLGQFLEPSDVIEAPAAPPAAPPVVLVSDLLDAQVTGELAAMAAAGRQDFVERVRRLYRDNAPAAAKRYIAAAAAGDAAEGALAAHALKSMSLNIGARAVADLCARLEDDARERGLVEPAMAEALYRKLLDTLEVLDGAPPAARDAPSRTLSDSDQALMDDLAHAAERGEFSLVYQPQVDRDGQAVRGLEALLRWTHPVRGAVSPAIFIPLAEHHGLIRPITRWVLDRAMEETADLPDISVGFNASAIEFADPHFVDDVAVQIARHRFDPARLEIEITETAILSDGEEVKRSIAKLHDLGVKIALDDFGVGYSSLSHLRLFPFDKLKIDRTFVTDCATDMQSATLVHAVVSVGRALGMKVVAEGIETEDQQKFLKLAGVHLMQGYRFGKPAPMAELRDRLTAQAPLAQSA